MIFTFVHRMGSGTKLAPNAFASNIGREIPFNLPSGERVRGKILAAEVAEDRTSVQFTCEVPDGTIS